VDNVILPVRVQDPEQDQVWVPARDPVRGQAQVQDPAWVRGQE
jgi:hypothetical protein